MTNREDIDFPCSETFYDYYYGKQRAEDEALGVPIWILPCLQGQIDTLAKRVEDLERIVYKREGL